MSERIVVVGGGAGGLELVVKLAKRLRREPGVEVVLVDKNPTHIWKPLFHEVATGSLNSYHDEASYRMLARKHGFGFTLGRVTSMDLEAKLLSLSAVDDEAGEPMVPEREMAFDTLVVAVGSLSNDFGIEGVADFSRALDSREEAERFHRLFTAQLHRVNSNLDDDSLLSIVIVGGGATGVELAADMHSVVRRLREYGFPNLSIERLKVSVIEAAPRLLPRLPERIGTSVAEELRRIGIDVRLDTQVSRVERDRVHVKGGGTLPADISVWAAGVRAPAFLAEAGFPVDRLGRIHVGRDLSVRDLPHVFAIGDCCAFTSDDGVEVPPRAQAAHQMASIAAKNILWRRLGRDTKPFVYKDFGSLINLSRYSTVGSLMGNLTRGTVFIEGWLARRVYLSLYRMHQSAVFGPASTLLIMLGDRIYKATRAEVKLH